MPQQQTPEEIAHELKILVALYFGGLSEGGGAAACA